MRTEDGMYISSIRVVCLFHGALRRIEVHRALRIVQQSGGRSGEEMQWLRRLWQLVHNGPLNVGTRFKQMRDTEIADVESRKKG